MRSLIFKAPGVLAVEDVPEPQPGSGEVLVELDAVGICGSDVHGYADANGRRTPGATMGHEICGRVLSLGTETTGWQVGDWVTINPVLGCRACKRCAAGEANLCPHRTIIGVDAPYRGGYSERMVAPATSLVPVDARVGVAASLVEPIAVALHAVAVADVRDGETVAVLGSGMIGLGCVWAARRAGARQLFATDVDPAKVALAERLGARGVPLGERSLRNVLDADGVAHVDRVVDAVGVSATVAEALDAVAPGGTVCIVGMGRPELALPAYPLITHERTIVGSYCYSTSDFAAAVRAVEDGTIDAASFVDREINLDEAPATFAELAAGAPGRIKTVVRPNAHRGGGAA